MATVKQIKAVTRSRSGKGAARAERRAGRVPGVIYGDGKPPLNVSVDHSDLKQRIVRIMTHRSGVGLTRISHRLIVDL